MKLPKNSNFYFHFGLFRTQFLLFFVIKYPMSNNILPKIETTKQKSVQSLVQLYEKQTSKTRQPGCQLVVREPAMIKNNNKGNPCVQHDKIEIKICNNGKRVKLISENIKNNSSPKLENQKFMLHEITSIQKNRIDQKNDDIISNNRSASGAMVVDPNFQV